MKESKWSKVKLQMTILDCGIILDEILIKIDIDHTLFTFRPDSKLASFSSLRVKT